MGWLNSYTQFLCQSSIVEAAGWIAVDHENRRIIWVALTDVENVQGLEIFVYGQGGCLREVASCITPLECWYGRIFHSCIEFGARGRAIARPHDRVEKLEGDHRDGRQDDQCDSA